MKRMWTPKDLVDILEVPLSWVYERTRKNGPEVIPHLKLGKYVRFDPESEAFRSWLVAHEVRPEETKQLCSEKSPLNSELFEQQGESRQKGGI